MLSTLIVCVCLGTNLHAGGITSSMTANDGFLLDSTRPSVTSRPRGHLVPTTFSSAPFDEDAELAKIAASCISSTNYEQLTGNIVRRFFAQILGSLLIPETVVIIGLTELRATLNLAPLPPWQHFNDTDPTDSDLASAPTIQAYYDLKEPRSVLRSLDGDHLYEKNLTPSIAYFDKRFPSIRTIFRRRFEEIRRSGVRVLDRKAIDRMIDEFVKIHKRVRKAVEQMTQRRNHKCWDAVD